jgi:hypothetical protein
MSGMPRAARLVRSPALSSAVEYAYAALVALRIPARLSPSPQIATTTDH